jgi:hypothetical protein
MKVDTLEGNTPFPGKFFRKEGVFIRFLSP